MRVVRRTTLPSFWLEYKNGNRIREEHRESMGSMKNALERATGLYEKTEQNICVCPDREHRQG